MSAFRVVWHKKTIKELRTIPKKIAKQLIIKVSELGDDPIKKSFPLAGCNFRKIRVGEYRAIIEVVFDKKLVKVLLVGHRRNIYKKLFR
ncbi:MAG: type II toxin-antitoxin system RelE/ParE family toxin [Candidatus Diapherotrites archaeon]|nr:type II toxin-antitoxin system RelE/ParE family toxin [Candidatus Diapherotrites archaeon]